MLVYILVWVDNFTINNASSIITPSNKMKDYLLKWRQCKSPIHVLDNPSAYSLESSYEEKHDSVIFCGNLGRMQQIPLLTKGISRYLDLGGALKFIFVGGGVYSHLIDELAANYSQVVYFGVLSGEESAKKISQSKWGLVSIENHITNYAFPSKIYSYAHMKCPIIAVCENTDFLAEVIRSEDLGLVCEPSVEKNSRTSFFIENGTENSDFLASCEFLERSNVKYFANKLSYYIGLTNVT